MPKQKITKEMVVDAAFALAREGGMEQVLVKNLADRLGCSVQPVYSYCRNMEGLRREVEARAMEFVREYVAARVDEQDLFRSTGRAHLKLAGEEPHIFKIFILHQREGISSLEELYQKETAPQMAERIGAQLKLGEEAARELHLHMLIYTLGLGTIFSVTRPGISAEEIVLQQEKAYEAFLCFFEKEGTNGA